MHCENCFCIYWNNKKCILDKISINQMGGCQECIYVEMEEDALKEKREKTLIKYADEM